MKLTEAVYATYWSICVTINATKIHCTTAVTTSTRRLLLPLPSSLPPSSPSAGEERDDLLELHVQDAEGEGAGGQQQRAVVAAAAAAAATRAGVLAPEAAAARGYPVISAGAVHGDRGGAVATER